MRKNVPGEYYHIYNRGTQKQDIFNNDEDRIRFLFLLLTFQGKKHIANINRTIKNNVQNRVLNIRYDLIQDIVEERIVEIVAFCLMPNHFHIIIKEVKESGIAEYTQRVFLAYTKYFNTRYEKSGHLFQGSYKSVHIIDDEQLMYLSAYIHKNPLTLREWKLSFEQYPWSSYQDYIGSSRWGDLLVTEIILTRFVHQIEYKQFVHASIAKEPL